ncbi:hypothetical protein RHMOL_Rhmol08G0252800 [Rhododendron molle]|uniref:Uncharacterized protein n=1 Tax=Rhododendron molle TaxID=49168 RepID=A0ACC0MS92_RHOML|nr:hypothetical protein RHMOL_Rhmol08G0252800 [Rhododendron molle]
MDTRMASLFVRVKPVLEDFMVTRRVRLSERSGVRNPLQADGWFSRRIICTTEESYAEALKTNLMAVYVQPSSPSSSPSGLSHRRGAILEVPKIRHWQLEANEGLTLVIGTARL